MEGDNYNTFTCGQCVEQFYNLLDFLSHRLQRISFDVHFGRKNRQEVVNCLSSKAIFYKPQLDTISGPSLCILASAEGISKDTKEENSSRCELCRKSFSSMMITVRHYKLHHAVDVFDKSNSDIDSAELDEYQKLSQQRRKYLKGEKDYQFQLMTDHIKKQDSFQYTKQTFYCIHCDYKSYTATVLSKHMVGKHESAMDGKSKLDGDIIKAGEVVWLSEYLKMNAERQEEPAAKPRTPQRRTPCKERLGEFLCVTCGKSFKRARSLRTHMEIHRTERNFLCDECGKAFKSQTRLHAHRKVHRKKVFICAHAQCTFQSNVNSLIHQHRQLHPAGCVLCEICGFAYTDKSTLGKHMRVHSQERPFSCTYNSCTWRFKTEAMCKAHIRSHSSSGKFKCQSCGYVFRHKHHLHRHQNKMHGVKLSTTTEQLLPRKRQEEESSYVVWHTTAPPERVMRSGSSAVTVPLEVFLTTLPPATTLS